MFRNSWCTRVSSDNSGWNVAAINLPWRTSTALAERLASRDVRVTLVKDGDHRLSTESDLSLLMATLETLL